MSIKLIFKEKLWRFYHGNLNFNHKIPSNFFVKNRKFWSKIENVGQKSKIVVENRKFWSTIENVGQKSKILVNNRKCWPKIENVGQKSKILVKNRKFTPNCILRELHCLQTFSANFACDCFCGPQKCIFATFHHLFLRTQKRFNHLWNRRYLGIMS